MFKARGANPICRKYSSSTCFRPFALDLRQQICGLKNKNATEYQVFTVEAVLTEQIFV